MKLKLCLTKAELTALEVWLGGTLVSYPLEASRSDCWLMLMLTGLTEAFERARAKSEAARWVNPSAQKPIPLVLTQTQALALFCAANEQTKGDEMTFETNVIQTIVNLIHKTYLV